MTEHGAISFAYFFLGEYTNMLTISTFFSIFFFGIFFNLPLIFIMFWLRASLPRLRFDQLIILGWSYLLPISVSLTILISSLLFTFDILA
jgi:NADH:ubiquinone oxidoreductase subunit H